MAMWIVFARFVDVYFLIAPEFYDGGLTIHWMDAAAVVGLGGVWIALFAANLKSQALLPGRDPDLASALKAAAGH
jgi:hypothetical protein